MPSIYRRGEMLWCRLKDESGKWISSPTELPAGREEDARKFAARAQKNIDARRAKAAPVALTVKAYGEKWINARKGRVATWNDEEARLRLHVYPTLGETPLDALRPRQVRDWILALKEAGGLAPRTIRHTFQTLRRMYRTAVTDELVATNPVVVDAGVLPKNRDKNPAWRAGAIYTRAEVELLISSADVPTDRRVLYGLQALAGLRSGEARRLRWCDYDPSVEPLGRLHVIKTKTGVPRQVPTHPTLAAMLAEWKLARQPAPGDLIIPPREAWEVVRERSADLKELGLRHRRGHDLRRTFISLAREDGARGDLLEIITHGPKGDMITTYSTITWRTLCDQVSVLKIERRAPAEVVGIASGLATDLLQEGPVPGFFYIFEPMAGLEPATYGLRNRCSTD
jgi:integrase